MNFASYPAFRNAVLSLIDGDDVSQSDLSVFTLDLMIGAGEIRVYRDLRSSLQDTALSVTTTGNVAPLPVDFLEAKSVYVAGFKPADYMPYEQIAAYIQRGSVVSARALFFSFQGDNLVFYPMLADGSVVSGRYIKRFSDISTGVNVLLNRHPDVFIYAALAESGPFLGDSERLPIWEGKYTMLVKAANEQERRRLSRGSKLQSRVAGSPC
jgi:hypothetical protein